jgi:hypothetical protein
MPRRTEGEDDWEEGEEWDGDADSDEDVTVPCPYCRRPVPEDAPRCPHCENYISREDAPPSRKPWWIVLGALLCLYAVYRWIVG